MATLDQLKTFLAVYRAGSLTAAAQALHLSQPAVSGHLRAVEDGDGRPLFVRLGRGVSPTQRGHTLARAVAPHIDALNSLRRGVDPALSSETVVIGGAADLLSLLILPALKVELESFLRLRVHSGLAEPLLDQLGAGALDLVVATRRKNLPGIKFETLFHESLVLVGTPEWLKRVGPDGIERDPVQALAEVPWLSYDDDLPLIRHFCEEVFDFKIQSSASVVMGDLRALAALVAEGVGVSVLPRYVVAGQLRSGSLVELYRPEEYPSNQISLAYRAESLMRPGVAAAHATLQAQAGAWN